MFGPWLTSGNMAFKTFPKWWSYVWIKHLLSFWESGILVVVVRKTMHMCPASIKTLNSWILLFCDFLTEILYTHGCIFASGGSMWLHFCLWRKYALCMNPHGKERTWKACRWISLVFAYCVFLPHWAGYVFLLCRCNDS